MLSVAFKAVENEALRVEWETKEQIAAEDGTKK